MQYVLWNRKIRNEYAINAMEQMLLDIRNKDNVDDERVLCYVQPIRSVKSGTFRTAEALMRLQFNDTIFQDRFRCSRLQIICLRESKILFVSLKEWENICDSERFGKGLCTQVSRKYVSLRHIVKKNRCSCPDLQKTDLKSDF